MNRTGRRKQHLVDRRAARRRVDAQIRGERQQSLVVAIGIARTLPARASDPPVRVGRPGPHQSAWDSFHSSHTLRVSSVSRSSRLNPRATAKRSAPSPTSITWPVWSMTSVPALRRCECCARRPPRPARREGPCMQLASSSTTPSSFGRPPRPTLSSFGSSSGPRTTLRAAIERVGAAVQLLVAAIDVRKAVAGRDDDRQPCRAPRLLCGDGRGCHGTGAGSDAKRSERRGRHEIAPVEHGGGPPKVRSSGLHYKRSRRCAPTLKHRYQAP